MRRVIAVFFVAALAAGLTACAEPGATAAPPLAVEDTCPQASTPLASLGLIDDVRGHEGPSTACLSSHAIDAVDDDTAPDLPVTVTDGEGRDVEITDVDRILPIDISGTIASTVFALGLGDQVVGRDASTDFVGTEDLPVVTKTGHTLNAEAILELSPTVILTDTTIGPKEVRQQLRDAGIAVVVISSDRRLDTTDELVTEIATALGVPSRGEALIARLDAAVDETLAEISEVVPADEADRARMLFLYVRGSANVYYIFGEDSGADSLIDAVGGVDVAAEIGWEGMKPLTAEALVAAQPDVLVMMTDGLESVGGIDGLIERIPAVAQTPAGAHRRVIDMADSEILSFGPRTADVIGALARALYAPEPAK
ncbi:MULTISPECIES: heme/hemin ABC transporter substrate-binding protein [Microbacterium]|uniref:ABC transporter substrate-binding protein n=1 Tax=Microbacterium aurugineum TaxID=2851642 RepID=A0ABY4J459_9MICO|nr:MULTISPECIES: ABC transporter substrate-binding protein [Microbacterium]QEA28308.1 ABC transporter substrate-binding protein [Microbacterium sp. CBA3102]UPL18942.1 ABC transporter substrate-binding protein [Microbacterium aurugineum]